MGIFTSNTLSSISGVDYSDLPALEGYDAVTGCATAMLEVHQNDMALFNAAIMEDFKEVAAMNEGVTVLNESASDVLNKIKEIFKKLLQKIKGIFNAFIAKLSQTFGSAESVYNKYKKQISAYNKWGKFEVKKFREVKGKGSVLTKLVEVGKYANTFSYVTTNDTWFGNDLTKESIDIDDINKGLIKNRIINSSLKSDLDDDFKNMDVAFMDAVYEAEDTKDDWNVSDILGDNIGTLLEKNAGKKFKENIESANKNLNDVISKIIADLDKEALKINDAAGAANRKETDKAEYTSKIINANSGNMDMDSKGKQKYTKTTSELGKPVTGSKELSQSIANLQKIATQEQTLITSFTSARLKATKFAIAQARRVWSSAAAYSSTEHKNEGVEFYTAIGEAAEYDFISDMESICG